MAKQASKAAAPKAPVKVEAAPDKVAPVEAKKDESKRQFAEADRKASPKHPKIIDATEEEIEAATLTRSVRGW